ncbi:putative clathrin assembly protein At5g35200 [Hibiscus syriacus]|uniref:putative clathrin assembly protein At5g35200 n=1 Tax=Hibiscus syriacus TaxID=106335 RepID=UPI001924828E|nr:putative clathrin assembly protein At5g35200 [Hibiscus syriacus]
MPSSSQHSFIRAIVALKDSTMVGLARVNSGHKEVEIAVVKATDRKEEIPKEKYVRTILAAAGSRYDAAFCIHTLLKRLSKTRTWTRNGRLDTPDLLDQLPVLQELLGRLLNCKPVGSAFYSHLIHYVVSIIAGESVKLYIAISDGVLNLVDKYFEMQRDHALRALEIYKKVGEQATQLSEFFEICRGLHYGQGQKYLKIKPLPDSFLIAMEEYVKDTPEVLALPYYTSV